MEFFDESGQSLLKREIKCIEGGYNSFNRSLSEAASQVGFDGEVWIQTKTPSDISNWLNKFRSTPGRDMAKYKRVRLIVFDEGGRVRHIGSM